MEELELLLASPHASFASAEAARVELARLEARSANVCARLRARIRAHRYTPDGLRRVFTSAQVTSESTAAAGYDFRDALLAGLLCREQLAPEALSPEPELVFYQPTPARVIAKLLERAGLGPRDRLCDLGSGLGHVLILARLLFGARALGVEREPTYCAHAAQSVRELGLDGIDLVCDDARTADLGSSNVFFLYTPFRGAVLDEVLARLQQHARGRRIRVCSYGPCSEQLAGTPWLVRLHSNAAREHDVLVFESSCAASA